MTELPPKFPEKIRVQPDKRRKPDRAALGRLVEQIVVRVSVSAFGDFRPLNRFGRNVLLIVSFDEHFLPDAGYRIIFENFQRRFPHQDAFGVALKFRGNHRFKSLVNLRRSHCQN